MDIDRLGDLIDIYQLKARYCRYADTKQWEGLRDVVTDDFVFLIEDSALPTPAAEPIAVGGDSFVETVCKNVGTAVIVHHVHSPEIEFTGPDSARGIWATFDWTDDPSHPSASQGFGHFHEEYRRGDDGKWRHSKIHLTRLRVDEVTPTRKGERPWPPPWKRAGH